MTGGDPGTLVRRLLPAPVVGVEMFGDDPAATLLPEEAERIARAAPKRRREYTSVRHCARAALGRLGIGPVPILSGANREPLWPSGVVGAMTHCDGYRAAAVGRAADVVTVGIDAEPAEPLPDGVLDAISLPAERTRLARLGGTAHWDRLLFCAKEAVYKAWFPLTGRWLGFEDAEVTLDPAHGRFSARLLVPGPTVDGVPVHGFEGRWLSGRGLLLAAIAVPRSAPGSTPGTDTEM